MAAADLPHLLTLFPLLLCRLCRCFVAEHPRAVHRMFIDWIKASFPDDLECAGIDGFGFHLGFRWLIRTQKYALPYQQGIELTALTALMVYALNLAFDLHAQKIITFTQVNASDYARVRPIQRIAPGPCADLEALRQKFRDRLRKGAVNVLFLVNHVILLSGREALLDLKPSFGSRERLRRRRSGEPPPCGGA